MVYTLEREQVLPRPIAAVFEFFADAGNLEAITPPWLHFHIRTPRPIAMQVGALIEYSLRLHGLPIRWTTRIAAWNPPHSFVDMQIRGPYRLWEHTHRFVDEGESTRMFDVVRYALPFGPLGGLAHRILVRSDLKKIFDYRAEKVAALIGVPSSLDRTPRRSGAAAER